MSSRCKIGYSTWASTISSFFRSSIYPASICNIFTLDSIFIVFTWGCFYFDDGVLGQLQLLKLRQYSLSMLKVLFVLGHTAGFIITGWRLNQDFWIFINIDILPCLWSQSGCRKTIVLVIKIQDIFKRVGLTDVQEHAVGNLGLLSHEQGSKLNNCKFELNPRA